ncbi:glycosyltransferase [Salinibacter ruber]|uniref:glycosyltransferase n=1 Tax=Salinibacter ruber TaxID=146919 RepID=UPI002169C4C9|nr:glycosyltransferase [Salinibacter ruber]MCS4149392.1 glycosyltransferase involved in cell wall biosynthesis [Salinibacter ruber]
MSDDRPSITVLMGVHNGLPYLNQAVKSVLDQTFSDFEFLIIDDASTDGSLEVLRKWRRQDSRIRIITNEKNRGLGYVLSEGAKEANAPLIARMDADDVAVKDRLEAQKEYMLRHPSVDVLGGWAEECNEGGNVIGHRIYPVNHKEIVKLIWTNPIVHSSAVFRKKPILRIGGYNKKLRKRQDYELWFRCHNAGLRFANLPKTLIRYRYTDDHFRRNDWKVALRHVLVGWRGCYQVGAPAHAYLGVAFPLLRAMFPERLQKLLNNYMSSFDPRNS